MSFLFSKLLRQTENSQKRLGSVDEAGSDENDAQRQMSDEDVYRSWVSLWSLKEERAQVSRDATLRRLSERRQQLAGRKHADESQNAFPEVQKQTSAQLHIAGNDGRAMCGIKAGMEPLNFARTPRFRVNAKSVTVTAGSKICSSCKSRAIEYAVNAADKQRAEYENALNASITAAPD